MFFYILYRLGYFLANILPLKGAYWLSERFADLKHLVSKKDRGAVIENLSIVLKKDKKECHKLAQEVFRNFGLYLVDFFRMNRLNKEDIKRRIEVVGIENMDRILKEKTGIIALSCHIGNWEMGGVALGIMGYDISAVALTHKYKRINDFFISQRREEKGMKVIAINSVMKRCISVLLKGGVLALVGDRDFTNSGVTLDFFGMPTSLPKGPAMLSLKTNSPIVPVFLIRHNRFNFKFIFDKPIELKVTPGVDKEKIVKEATEKLVPVMERYIRKYPEQWLLFRKFWETPVDGFVL